MDHYERQISHEYHGKVVDEAIVKMRQREDFRRAWKKMQGENFPFEDINLQPTPCESPDQESLHVSRLYWPPLTPQPARQEKNMRRDHEYRRNLVPLDKEKKQRRGFDKTKSKAKKMFRGLKKVKERVLTSLFPVKLFSPSSSTSSSSNKSYHVAPRRSI